MTTAAIVELGVSSYRVHTGAGLLARLDEFIVPPVGACRAALVTQEPVAALYGDDVEAALRRSELEVRRLVVPDGETAKSLRTVERLYDQLAHDGFGRSDMVVALGGGVVGDLAAFLAGTWHRGIALVQVPTTLLAQVDAAIGGKAAINLVHGKNLVGCFHQPTAVVSDVTTLRSLPSRELVSGLGEVIKYGVLGDAHVLGLIERDVDAVMRADPLVLEDLVARCVGIKARVVSADERETGARAHLNLGHTFGHALETVTRFERYLHGEAVAVGLRVALQVGVATGVTPSALERRVTALLERVGLPTQPPRLDRDALWAAMGRDKKAAADGVRFVLVGEDGPVVLVPPRATVDAVLDALEEAA